MSRNEFGSATLGIACVLAFCWVTYELRWRLGDGPLPFALGGGAALGTAGAFVLAVRVLRRFGDVAGHEARQEALRAERQREEIVPLVCRLLRDGFGAVEADRRFLERVRAVLDEAQSDAEAEAMLLRTDPRREDGWPEMRRASLHRLLSEYRRPDEFTPATRVLLRRLLDDRTRRAGGSKNADRRRGKAGGRRT